MKKILILLSAPLFACCGDNGTDTVESQSISISPEAIVFDAGGGVAEGLSNSVAVTSSADWTLAGDTSWCTPSAVSGGDGATVAFTASANTGTEIREVNLYFICGDAAAQLTVTQFPEGVVDFIDLEDVYNMGASGGAFVIRLNTNLDVSDYETSDDWVSLRGGDGDSEIKWVVLEVGANMAFYDREATVTLFAGTSFETVVTVRQEMYRGVIVEGPTSYEFGVEGGEVVVTVSANSPFDLYLNIPNAEWITVQELTSTGTDIITKTYSIVCEGGDLERSGYVTATPDSGSSVTIYIYRVNPDPELFDIPDPLFARYLTSNQYIIAKDGRYYLTYAGYAAASITVSGSTYFNLESFEGLERLASLTSFTNLQNIARRIDVSGNTLLTQLNFSYFPLEELILGDVGVTSFTFNNTMFNYNDLTDGSRSFTISGTRLTSLSINHTQWAVYDIMEWVDITGCPALTTFSCNRIGGALEYIYVTQAQKDAYDAGTLTITTAAGFDPTSGIVVR